MTFSDRTQSLPVQNLFCSLFCSLFFLVSFFICSFFLFFSTNLSLFCFWSKTKSKLILFVTFYVPFALNHPFSLCFKALLGRPFQTIFNFFLYVFNCFLFFLDPITLWYLFLFFSFSFDSPSGVFRSEDDTFHLLLTRVFFAIFGTLSLLSCLFCLFLSLFSHVSRWLSLRR